MSNIDLAPAVASVQAPPPPPPPPPPLRYTRITSTNPAMLGKRLSLLADGTMHKVSSAAVVTATAEHASAAGLRALCAQLEALTPAQAVAWGVAEQASVPVVMTERVPSTPGAIARSRQHFTYPAGPGVLMLDHDGAGALGPLDAATLVATLTYACPELMGAPMLCRPSTSAGVQTTDGRVVSPLTRWRVYLAVSDAREVPDAGKRLETRLWAAGLGWFRVSKSGAPLARTLVDTAVWCPEWFDFVADPELGPGLIRPRVEPMFFGNPDDLFELSRIVVSPDHVSSAETMRKAMRDAVSEQARQVREPFVSALATRIAELRGLSRNEAAEVVDRALVHNELAGDFPLTLADGSQVAVHDVLADPKLYGGMKIPDPLEPDYRGDNRIARINLDGPRPNVHSFAHGGVTYHLLPDALRVFGGAAVAAAPPALLALAPPSGVPPAPATKPTAVAASPEGMAPTSAATRMLLAEDPLATARELIACQYSHDGRPGLKYWQGSFYRWDGSAYSEAPDADIRAAMWAFIDRNGFADFRPNSTRVSNAIDATKAAANLEACHVAPCWIDTTPHRPPAHELIGCRNGLLHLPTRTLLGPTPAFFSLNSAPYKFDPAAPTPINWVAFLRTVWPDDPESISTLQEVFGYLLTPDTSQQKLFMVVGPKRSGKGTIARVLAEVLGPANVAAPTLSSLAGNFGLAPLVGKLAAIVSDARVSARVDQQQVAENLLRISGEDHVGVDRKFKETVTMKLGVRFLVMTNELPRIADASGAMASRFVLLTMNQSFLGREDHGLTAKLLQELPGILLWAVDGWHRLNARGHFTQPKSAAAASQDLADLGSPVIAFVREECQIGPAREVVGSQLYLAWSTWCARQGVTNPGSSSGFGMTLRAALPSIERAQRRIEGKSTWFYVGVGIHA